MRTLQVITEKVLIHGKRYNPAMLPNEIKRGKVGDCFDTALIQTLKNPKFRYVEGIAKRPSNGEWVLHAWLTDGVNAFDPTWGILFLGKFFPLKTEYIGIEMNAKQVLEFCVNTEYRSVLHNGWRDEKRSEKLLGFKF
jgi:hypothetical protein